MGSQCETSSVEAAGKTLMIPPTLTRISTPRVVDDGSINFAVLPMENDNSYSCPSRVGMSWLTLPYRFAGFPEIPLKATRRLPSSAVTLVVLPLASTIQQITSLGWPLIQRSFAPPWPETCQLNSDPEALQSILQLGPPITFSKSLLSSFPHSKLPFCTSSGPRRSETNILWNAGFPATRRATTRTTTITTTIAEISVRRSMPHLS